MREPVLVTDEERLRAAADLEAAAAAGILTLGELDVRLRDVWSARTQADVAVLVRDLPPEWLRARRRAEAAARAMDRARRELPGRVRSWLLLTALLVGIWALTTPGGYFWPIWPLLGTAPCLLGSMAAARGPRRAGVGAP